MNHLNALVRVALLTILIGGVATVGASPEAETEDAPEGLLHYRNDGHHPVIFAGETIHLRFDVQDIEFFTPLFGSNRALVNHTQPLVDGRRSIHFELPGEYYLAFNQQRYLKVLVLSPHEPISKGVLRIFDFLVANLLQTNGDLPLWINQGKSHYVRHWFHRKEPGLLLCGGTDAMFRELVYERFRLPTRHVTFPGVYRHGGKIYKSTHNVSEVFLPDIGKFVMFDVNNAFVAQWMGAIELARLVNSAAQDQTYLSAKQWRSLDLNMYQDAPNAFLAVKFDVLGDSALPTPFSPALVSAVPVQANLAGMSHYYYGGVGYRGEFGYGSNFLPNDYHFGSLHRDPELERVAVEWISSFDLTISVHSLDELETLLEAGFSATIRAAEWRKRVPRTMADATLRLAARPKPAYST